MAKRSAGAKKADVKAEAYRHTQEEALLRPDAGLQAQFRKRKPAAKYEFDPSRDPRLEWAGKQERISFEVPTLPLFVHERLSTKAILETLKGHKKVNQFELFGDPQHSITDQILKAYEHKDRWVNRMILGDSLVVMNSLVHYENLGGQVQMIYMDPPYGVKFGSNFQPFVRRRDVKHNADGDMTREPEMVQAYRDTWELGIHSYLTYLRDRLLLCRELLAPTGSIFVQISDENVHHVREVMDEVMGGESFVSLVAFQKTSSASGELLSSVADYLLWYAKDRSQLKYRQLYLDKAPGEEGASQYTWAELPDGTREDFGSPEKLRELPRGSKIFVHGDITSQRPAQGQDVRGFAHEGRSFVLRKGTFKTDLQGLQNLANARRLMWVGDTLRYVRYLSDFSVYPLSNVWTDTGTSGFAAQKLYVVQTNPTAIQRCLLMTTDPGDLVLDPTCGSGTTAYVAEQWGRRWITIDTSRVPLALARQRLLTATFPYYELKTPEDGPGSGFVYKRKQNAKGEDVGGIVPHVTLKSIAQNEPPQEEVLVDRPEVVGGVTRVTGPFAVEASIPPAKEEATEEHGAEGAAPAESDADFATRMLEILRKSPALRLPDNRTVTLRNIRPLARTLSLSAEAEVLEPTPEDLRLEAIPQKEMDFRKARPVALALGPENGAVAERIVFNAAKEAFGKSYTHLYVIGFAIQPDARKLVDHCAEVVGIPATYVQATPDIMMGDLLKNLRSSQIFSVCGLPEVRLLKPKAKKGEDPRYKVELVGLDVFDPSTMETHHDGGGNVPAWFLDTDYNDLCFHVTQAFFPRTSAWDNLKRALKGVYADSVWDHLAGTVSEPFPAGEKGQIAVKVIDDRGNELMVVKKLAEAEEER